ncbi:alpha-(1,3)-fucosyltransferase 10-like isoform X2 [Dendronephthya gigantea]|nr:alpha-(1,3)-fucosyltransferase 10-like isoform X2 [Dendronephthya gigantea]
MEKDIPILLWWTPFSLSNEIRKCSMGECYTTVHRTMKNDRRTQVFLFYGTDFNVNDIPLPRKANHEWALFHEESPKNNAILFHEDTIVLFNHTATFRRHSDFPLVTQSLDSIDILEQKPWYSLDDKKSDKNMASVVYVQSSCNAPSDRDTYVQELMKYLKVDSLGQCLNNKELPQEYKDTLTFSNKGFYKIVGKYKFTLAFENAICDDYITEKLWRPLETGSVPIYRGSPSVLDWMPNNHSVILVDDFSSPQELAEYIKKLDNDDAAYMKYLDFKQKGGVTNTRLLKHMKERKWNMVSGESDFLAAFECLVCDRLHENLKRQKSGLPMARHVADQNHFGCPRPVQFKYPLVKGVEQPERDIWKREFDDYRSVAKALNKAVREGEKQFKSDLYH